MSDSGRVLTIQEVAAQLGCKRDHVRSLILSGRLRAYDIGATKKRASYRIIPEWLDEFIAASIVSAPERPPIVARRVTVAKPKHLRTG